MNTNTAIVIVFMFLFAVGFLAGIFVGLNRLN